MKARSLILVAILMVSISAFAQKFWTGGTGSYTTAGNWSPPGIPAAGDNIVINTANGPTLSSNTPVNRTVNSITFSTSGAYIRIATGYKLIVRASITNSSGSPDVFPEVAAGNVGEVEVSYTGSGTYPISGSINFQKLRINSTGIGTVQLQSGSFQIFDYLQLVAGTLDVNSQPLTTIATATKTAVIDQPSGATLLGNVTIQQYVEVISGGVPVKTYHGISTPCSNTFVGDFSNYTGGGLYDLTPSNSSYPTWSRVPDFIQYDETQYDAAGPPGDFFIGYNNNSLGSGASVNPAQGYFIRINPTSSIIEWVGPVNDPISYFPSTTYTNNSQIGDGANYLGNPYPEPIDWNSVPVSSEFSTGVNIWQSDGTEYFGIYATYDQSTGAVVNPGDPLVTDGIIPLGQAFVVKMLPPATLPPLHGSTGPILPFEIPNAARSMQTNYPFYKKPKPVISNRIGLAISGHHIKDETAILLLAGASVKLDEAKDITKLPNPVGNFYSVKDNVPVAINKLPFPESEISVPLALEVPETGVYTLSLSQFAFTDQYSFYLEDKLDNTYTLIADGFSYHFSTNSVKDDNRFTVHVVNNKTTGIANIDETAALRCFADKQNLYVNIANTQAANTLVMITDMQGKVIYNRNTLMDSGKATIDISTISSGLYLVNVLNGNDNLTQKVVLTK